MEKLICLLNTEHMLLLKLDVNLEPPPPLPTSSVELRDAVVDSGYAEPALLR